MLESKLLSLMLVRTRKREFDDWDPAVGYGVLVSEGGYRARCRLVQRGKPVSLFLSQYLHQ